MASEDAYLFTAPVISSGLFRRDLQRIQNLRDECQDLVRLKRMTQEEVDDLLGKPIRQEDKLHVITGTDSAEELEERFKFLCEVLANHRDVM